VRQNVAFPTRVSGFAADFTLVELLHALAMLRRASPDLRARGIPFKFFQLSVERNAVVVGVKGDVTQFGKILREQFGRAVVVEHSYGAAPA
jgi:hypothetical protein